MRKGVNFRLTVHNNMSHTFFHIAMSKNSNASINNRQHVAPCLSSTKHISCL